MAKKGTRGALRSKRTSRTHRSGGSFGGSGGAARSKSRSSSRTPARKRTRSTPPARRKSTPSRKSDTPAKTGSSPLRRRAARRSGGTPAATRAQRGGLRGGTTATRPPVRRRSSATRGGTVGSAGGTRTVDLQQQLEQVRHRFTRLQASADLGDVQQTVGRTDARLAELARELEALRSRGYVHAGLLDEEIASLDRQWTDTRPDVERALRREARALKQQVASTARQVNSLSVRDAAALAAANTAVNGLQSEINSARSNVRSLFSEVDNQIAFVEQTLRRFDWVLEQFDLSPNVRLLPTEAPVMAAEAQWHRDGDEGPVGILYLTDQRLLFEQNEEVATEKLFGLFTTKSDQVQRLLLDIPVHQIEKIEHGEEGGFLGIGKQEMLDLILNARAPVSRARFQLEGQDAADWAVWLKRVQTGEIDRDRDEAYQAEVEAAAARAELFPTKCPSCFAPLPTPPRGAKTAICDYCGTIVKPVDDVEP